MTTSPVKRLVLRLAAPTVVSMLVTSLYNIADTFFVGKIGTSATAAVGIALPLMNVIQALGFMFGHGSGNNISRMLGARRTDEASRMASVGFFSSIIAGILVLAIGLSCLKPLVRFMGATDTMLPHAVDYVRVILIGAPIMMGSLVLNNQMRFQGSASYAMVGIISGAVINIGLDPLFIFVFKMGTEGAAIATVISQAVSFILLYIGVKKGGNVRVSIKNFRPKLSHYKAIFAGGLPSLWRQGLASVAMICLNVTARVYGDAAVAAMTVVSKIMMFAGSALIGFGQGFQPVCGFNYGAAKFGRVRESFWFCIYSSVGFMALLGVLGYIFSPQLVALFRDDPAVIEIGAAALRYQCLTLPLMSWFTISNMMLQTIGKSFRASILAASRQGLFFIPLIFILAHTKGLLGIQITQPVSDLFSFTLALPLTLSVLREMKKAEKALAEEAAKQPDSNPAEPENSERDFDEKTV